MTTVTGTAIVLRGDDIDTDRIMPARFLKAVTFEGLETHVFADDRHAAATQGGIHPFDDPARSGAAILIVGSNFGCGSSREHAPQGLRRRGIRAIVGRSFAEIFFANALAIGLPCVTVSARDLAALMDLAETSSQRVFDVDVERQQILAEGALTVSAQLPTSAREAFLAGTWDAMAMLLDGEPDIERVEASLPY